ncbi:hypothetical protein [Salipiger abyssi]|uniref:hypothetical protein n=1 Tax=Salipiger abyssi TaxID=1250539 RepID=UPI001A8E937D|nr:hypothetical protein [Salipiger abyssi]MBN9889729.1 hypothetical protein [Salipiger abyssi]
MCYRHGKLIDADDCTYTPELLKQWRRMAERRSELRHALGRELTPDDLAAEAFATQTVGLTSPDLMPRVAEVVRDSGMEIIWGKEPALAIRDAAIEIARNALTHGMATEVVITVTAHSVELSDDGALFSPTDLEMAETPRGGAHSMLRLRSSAPNVIVSYIRKEDRNVVTLTSTQNLNKVLAEHPCSTTVYGAPSSVAAAMTFIEERSECGTIFLRPFRGILSYSDLFSLKAGLTARGLTERDIVLVMEAHSEGIRKFLEQEIPNVRMIESR